MKESSYEAIVAGGGFAGVVTATALARAGLRVCVVEPSAQPAEALRGELLHARGVRMLESLGLYDALARAGSVAVDGFTVYRPGATTSLAPKVVLPYSQGHGIGIEHRTMVDALRRTAAAHPNIDFVYGPRAADVIRKHGRVVGLRCAGGEEFHAKLVIAADGRHSKLRRAIGIPTSVELLSHTLATTLRAVDLPVPAHGHVFLGGPGPILAYPFGHDSVRVQFDVSIRAAKDAGGLQKHLTEQYLHHLPAELRAHVHEALARPLMASANHAIYTESCVAPGAALVGDAAGCSHPLTATGMTVALYDAVTLAACVRELGPCDNALLAYQKRRNKFVRARETFAHALYEVFRGEEYGARALREGVFDYWSVERSRRASMDILTGEESTMRAFVREYLRVVSVAARHVVKCEPRTRLAEPIAALLVSAGRSMSFATDRALARIEAGRVRTLAPFPYDDTTTPNRAKAAASSRRLRTLLREHARPRSPNAVRPLASR